MASSANSSISWVNVSMAGLVFGKGVYTFIAYKCAYPLPFHVLHTTGFAFQCLRQIALDTRAGGVAPAMESQLSTLATCRFGVRTSLEAHNWLSCPCSANTALKTLNLTAAHYRKDPRSIHDACGSLKLSFLPCSLMIHPASFLLPNSSNRSTH